jgi:hypothetical protein
MAIEGQLPGSPKRLIDKNVRHGGSMEEKLVLARYALALSLVEDPDIAGDLFMDARDDEDLRARAATWRRENGFEPASPVDGFLPALDDLQRAQALHLARRAGIRRRVLLVGRLVMGLALVVAVLVGGQRILAGGFFASDEAALALAEDPIYKGKPVHQSDLKPGISLLIYQMEVTPVSLTLWWAVEGPEASGLRKELAPRLVAPESDLSLQENTSLPLGRNRVLGKTIYQGKFTSQMPFQFGVNTQGSIEARLPAVNDPTAIEHRVGRVFRVGEGSFRIHSVTLGRDYTRVLYTPSRSVPLPLIGLEVEGVLVDALRMPGQPHAPFELITGQIPKETRSLGLRFGGGVVIPHDSTIRLSDVENPIKREGMKVTIAVPFSTEGKLVLEQAPILVDVTGQKYPAAGWELRDGNSLVIEVDAVPPTAKLLMLEFHGAAWVFPESTVQVNLL